MKICSTISELEKMLAPYRVANKKIGFVPTMGALHKGHMSLISMSKAEAAVTVCSIFVNPTQFNNRDDLRNYPRTLEEDKRMLESAGCDVLFVPSPEEMYPGKDYSTINDDFGLLDKVMEGKSRPGHFAGMLTIVKKLFEAVKPDLAYFGRKDLQQLILIRHFTERYELPIDIKECPIIREADGLAMSSRNRLLSAEERSHAILIPDTLAKVKKLWGQKPIAELKKMVSEAFAMDTIMKLDYFEIVDEETLEEINETVGDGQVVVACIAAYCDKVRLIDNILLTK